jgi:bacteriocin biosynthesis cyclodehydratase domain-containing protein
VRAPYDEPVADELAQSAVLAAADVEFRAGGPGQCELAVGPRTYSLAMAPEVMASLADVVVRIVPELRRALPVGRQLGAAEIECLAPFAGRLREIGVLLSPGDRTVVDEEAARRLYTFICRRSAGDPDKTFAEVRARRVRVSAPPAVAGLWCHLLREQGLVADGDEDADSQGPADLTVVVSHDDAALAAANQRLCAGRSASLAVMVRPHRFRIGPWVRVGESACLRCFVSMTSTSEAGRSPGAPSGWATYQPGSLSWVGGLVSHLALRALLPMSAEHPWGRVTTVDVVDVEQTSVTALRDPFCPDCAEHAPASREWVAL